MKKSICILALVVAPAGALAAEEKHGASHGAAHDMPGMRHDTPGMSHDMGTAGRPGDPAKVSRTVEIVMSDDLRFTPARVQVKAGETLRFFLRNAGSGEHDMAIGPSADLKAHAEMMRAQPHMKHAAPNMARVAPGRRGGIVWQFTQAGTVDFACLVPGHYEGGMRGVIEVR